MAMDLAKRETPRNSIPSTTFNRETTMPRQSTDLPERQVFASLQRPDMSGAEQLAKILGLVNEVGSDIAGDVQAAHDKRDAAQAAFDFGTGDEDEERFAKSRAYRAAWQMEGVKKLSIDISTEVQEKVNAALSDPDNPPTLDDIHTLIEATFASHTHDSQGNLLDFGTSEAKAALGNSLSEIMQKVMPQAAAAIKTHQDTQLFATRYHNMTFERERGAPIGQPYYPEDDLPASAPIFKPVPKGWTGSEADAIFELGMTQDEAKAFIKTGKDPRTAPEKKAPVDLLAAPMAPFEGFGDVELTGHIGDSREGGSSHNGEDFPVPAGTAIKAPMAGTVVKSFRNDRGGNQVIVKMANGDLVGFAHLSKRDVQKGDTVKAGELLGLSGNTGHSTGAHVHMTVTVKGKKVSPTKYFAEAGSSEQAVALTGQEPELASAPKAPPVQRPGFDVEGFMQGLPPSVNKGEAKSWLIQTLIADATAKGDASLLNGLADSTRKDGTPSLNPEERVKVAKVQEQIRDHARVVADRQEKKLQDENAMLVLDAFNDPDVPDPSSDWLAEQGRKRLLDPSFAASMISHNEAAQHRAEAEAKADAREAERDAAEGYDAFTYGLEVERRSGVLSGSSFAEDQARYKRGEFGPVGSKKALARFKRATAAARAGRAEVEKDPSFAFYSGKLKTEYSPRTKSNGNLLAERSGNADMSAADYAGMQAHYKQKVDSGMSPEEAYRSAIAAYGPKKSQDTAAARKARIAELMAKRRS